MFLDTNTSTRKTRSFLKSSSAVVLSVTFLAVIPADAHAKLKIKKPKWLPKVAAVAVGAATGGAGGAILGGVIANNPKRAEEVARHVGREARNAVENVGEAAESLANIPGRVITSSEQIARQIARQVEEGKLIDAYLTLSFSTLRTTDRVASQTVMESSLLRTAASVAAGSFGPGGAAGFGAWYAYHASGGDLEATGKAALIGGASNFASGALAKASPQELSFVQRVAAASAVGAGTALVAGGNAEQIRDAALMGAAMVGVQEAFRAATTAPLVPKASEGEAYCKGDSCYLETPTRSDLAPRSIVNGKPRVDMRKVDMNRPHVGRFADPAKDGFVARMLINEQSPFMTAVSKVPGMNQMAVFHDHWSITWGLPNGINEATIIPATVFTYVGTHGPLADQGFRALLERRNKADERDRPSL